MARVGLVGFGTGGKFFHAPFVAAAGLELRAVVTSRADEVATLYPSADVLADPQALFARDDIDLVVISTPTASHAALALAALAAGKHVVVDKPFALDPIEAQSICDAAVAAARLAVPYQNRRWDSEMLTLRRLMADGALGELRHVTFRFDRWRPVPKAGWRTERGPGAGILYDLGSHLVDWALVLTDGALPDWVQADVVSTTSADGADDGFEMVIATGPLRVLVGSTPYASAAGVPRVVAHGTKGSFVSGALDCQEPWLRAGFSPLARGFGVGPEPPREHAPACDADAADESGWGRVSTSGAPASPVPSERGRYLSFWELLREAVAGRVPPPVCASDAVTTARVLEAAMHSAATGRKIFLAGSAPA